MLPLFSVPLLPFPLLPVVLGLLSIYLRPTSGSSLEPMPHRFLLAESMDVAKAWARWEMTLDWRKETNADNILSKPHPRSDREGG